MQDILQRLLILPQAVTGALLAKMSKANIKREVRGAAELHVKYISFVTMFALFAGLIIPYFFSYWMGNDFYLSDSKVIYILLAGIYFNALALFPYTELHSRGKGKLTAAIHAFELPLYSVILLLLLSYFGIIGAAMAWTFRTFIDYCILQFYSSRA